MTQNEKTKKQKKGKKQKIEIHEEQKGPKILDEFSIHVPDQTEVSLFGVEKTIFNSIYVKGTVRVCEINSPNAWDSSDRKWWVLKDKLPEIWGKSADLWLSIDCQLLSRI
jgi:hypothetical protein